jgi:hypothetical protein
MSKEFERPALLSLYDRWLQSGDPDRLFQLADLFGLISDHERLLGRVYPVRHEETARRILFVIANGVATISCPELSNREEPS